MLLRSLHFRPHSNPSPHLVKDADLHLFSFLRAFHMKKKYNIPCHQHNVRCTPCLAKPSHGSQPTLAGSSPNKYPSSALCSPWGPSQPSSPIYQTPPGSKNDTSGSGLVPKGYRPSNRTCRLGRIQWQRALRARGCGPRWGLSRRGQGGIRMVLLTFPLSSPNGYQERR